MAGKHGEVAEWQTHEEYWNFTQPEGLLKSESSSRFESGFLHKLVLEREHESIQLQMDISVMRIQIVFPME